MAPGHIALSVRMSPSQGYNSSIATWHPVSTKASFSLFSSTQEFHGQRAGQRWGSVLVCSETQARRRRRRRAGSYPGAADAAVAVGKLSVRHLVVQSSDVRCL